jgi:hypothetical protein
LEDKLMKIVGKLRKTSLRKKILLASTSLVLGVGFVLGQSAPKAQADCEFWQVGCNIGKAVNSWWDGLWTDVMTKVGQSVAGFFTLWLKFPTTGALGVSMNNSVQQYTAFWDTKFGNSAYSVKDIVGWITWIALAVGAAALIIYFVKLSQARQSGSGYETSKALFWIGIGCLIATSAGAIINILTTSSVKASNMVGWITNLLWPITLIALVIGVIMTGIKIMTEQNGKPLKEMVTVILTTILVANVGGAVTVLLCNAGDDFSNWVISSAAECKIGSADDQCFGQTIIDFFSFSPGNWLIALCLALIGLILSLIQVFIMMGRSIMLVLLLGLLALWSAVKFTKIGRESFEKCLAWIVALLVYKPIVAIVYGIGIKLAGSAASINGGQIDNIGKFIYFLVAIIMAILAMPAIIKIIAPAAGAVAGGGGMNMLAGAAGYMMARGGAPKGAAMMAGGPAGVAAGAAMNVASNVADGATGGESGSSDTSSGGSSSSSGSGGIMSSTARTVGGAFKNSGTGKLARAASGEKGAMAYTGKFGTVGKIAHGVKAVASAGPGGLAVAGAAGVANGVKTLASRVSSPAQNNNIGKLFNASTGEEFKQ